MRAFIKVPTPGVCRCQTTFTVNSGIKQSSQLYTGENNFTVTPIHVSHTLSDLDPLSEQNMTNAGQTDKRHIQCLIQPDKCLKGVLKHSYQ